jgi:hypothetical protein
MLRRFLIAAAGAVALAVLAAPFAQDSAAQPASASGCPGQSPQAAGNVQASQGQQQAQPAFRGGVRVAAGDVDGAGGAPSIRARTGSSQSKEGGKQQMELESYSWGNALPRQGCPSAARAPEERRPPPR